MTYCAVNKYRRGTIEIWSLRPLVVAAFILMFCCQVVAQSGSGDYIRLVQRVRPSIILITTYDGGGRSLKRGTGFCVGSGLFITNAHVVEGASKITIRTYDDKTYSVSVDSAFTEPDLALLKTTDEVNVPQLKLASRSPEVGTKVIVVGNPLGLTGTVSDGIVSAIRGDENELVQITAPLSHGSSGSPVVDLDGDVIGVATLVLEGGQNLNFAVSSQQIQSLWRNRFVTAPAAAKDRKRQLSSRWRLLNDDTTTYDKQTLSKVGEIVTVWIKYENKDATSEKVLFELDCGTRKIREVQYLSYNIDGDVKNSSSTANGWEAIVPDSNGEAYYKVLCGGKLDEQAQVEFIDLYDSGTDYEKAKNAVAAIEVYWKLLRLEFSLRQAAISKKSLGFISIYTLFAKNNLENLYEERKDTVGLEKLFRYLISTGDDSKHVNLAELYKKQGMTVKFTQSLLSGIKTLESRITSGSATSVEFCSLADLYVLQQQDKKAIALLRRGSERFEREGYVELKLAEIYNRQKRWKESVDLIENLLPAYEGTWRQSLLSELKRAYDGLGDTKNSVRIKNELK